MKTAVQRGFGLPHDVIEIVDLPMPEPKPGQVLVRIAASAVNALDWRYLTGTPYIARGMMGWRTNKRLIPGADISGTVMDAGQGSGLLSQGDEVFGDIEEGGFAEYVAVDETLLVTRPARLGMEESATLGVGALTALQGLRDWGKLQPGQRVLINGASGGVGTFAVQMARALGASHITAVCSTANVETVGNLGADRVVDYTKDNFSRSGEKFDLLFDNAGSWTLSECRSLLVDDGTLSMITAKIGRWVAPMPRLIGGRLRSVFWSQTMANDVAKPIRADLETIKEMVDSGQVTPVMDRVFSLDKAADALAYQGEGHARGKSVVTP